MRLPFHVAIGRALSAVALAILLYFVALAETNPADQRDPGFTIPVQPVNLPPGLVVTTSPPPIGLRVTAPQSVFSRLRPESFNAQVDATGAHAGDTDLPITVTTTDPEVRGIQPNQGFVRLHLEEVREQALPVRVNLTGQVPSGYQLGTYSVDPPRVTVAGASSFLGRASEAVVDVNVDRVTVSINGVFTVRITDERGNDLKDLNLKANPPAVTVQVPITQQTEYKEVGIRPIPQGQPAPGYVLQQLEVNPPHATLVGDAAGLEAANLVDTAPIDINGISTTTVRSVALQPPPRTLLLQDGQTVTVTIRVLPLAVNQTVRVLPSVINLSGSVQLARAVDLVSVTISGPAPALQNLSLNPGDFKVVVDAAGKGPGRYSLDVKVQQIPQGLTLADFSPSRIQVDLMQIPATPTPVPTPVPPTPVAPPA